MKMNHLTEEDVQQIMDKVKYVLESKDFSTEIMDEIFKLSKVDGEKYLECKGIPPQANNVNFELDPEQGVRFFDPFNFYTGGIYKDVDGWSRWTMENLKEPWT